MHPTEIPNRIMLDFRLKFQSRLSDDDVRAWNLERRV